MRIRLRFLALTLLVLSLVSTGRAAAQTGGTLQGPVIDDQGLALPGVTVTLTNTETGWTRAIVTNSEGWYRAAALSPGTYEIRAELSGFATALRSRVPLTLGQELTVRIELKVATLQETVTVTGTAPLIETTSNTLGTTVSREQLDSLPVPGRTFTALAQTAPGVTGVGGGGVNAGGQLSRNNSFRIDGVSNENNVLASPRGGLSLEAVREYVVIANQFAAEYGDASGAVISVVTRSGTNNLRGRAFLFHRDEAFDAQDPFSKAQGSGKAPFSQQRFGGFVGGPIRKDRMQYFGTYEGVRADRTSVITSPLVPVSEREVPNNDAGNQYFARTDSRFNDEHSLFFRYRLDEQKQFNVGAGGLNTIERARDVVNRNQDGVVSHTAIFTSRSLNELRVQFGRHFADNVVTRPLDSPTINRPSGNFGKASNQPQGRTEDRWEIVDNFSYSIASHDMKFGIDYSWIRPDSYFENNTGGTFTFTTDRPFDPSDLTTYPTQYTRNIGDSKLHRRNDTIGLFAQDSWRVRSNLTMNYGVRYDHETAFKEATGVDDASLNLAPRIGFAWDPFNDQKTVVRGGGGVYYSKVFLNITGNIMLARRFVGVTIVNPGFPDPYSRGTVAPQAAPSTTVAPDEVKTPVTRQFSVGVKRELFAGIAVSADYVNSRGKNAYNAPDVNAPDPVTGLRPDPAYLRITQYQTTGHSWYNGLLLGLERRAGRRGPQLGISYTLSRQMRDVEDFGFTAQNNYDRAAEKARASNDRRHQLVTNIVWSLPAEFQIGLFAQGRSGLPFNITTGVDNNRDTSINDRPDLANPNGDPTDPATYHATFTGRVGNLPRNFGQGPGYFEAHLRLSKFITLSRAKLDRLEIFIEALNATNYVNLGTPTGNLRSATFGRSTGINGDSSPRQVEIGFRLNF
ncbi:MAG: TonB-dependent receptor [Acidobacteriota bacterium]|nr:TonB-dependent receptor [Acidobacteriota bacterium]